MQPNTYFCYSHTMLSVLIPTYNTLVAPLVENIHAQCQKVCYPFEIIVLDDASDNPAFLDQYEMMEQLPNCRVFKNQLYLGGTKSRGLLADMAVYPWLLFLDADVMPKYPDFIQRFALDGVQEAPILFGGVTYHSEKPVIEEVLRWKYGMSREAKNVRERYKRPYFIVSGNLMIQKATFSTINLVSENVYGLDNIVSYFIYQNGIKVIHIDNPVFHLGLENSETFIRKSIESLETSIRFESKLDLPDDFRPIQKLYKRLKNFRLLGIFMICMKWFMKSIEKNLYSNNPNLKVFDLYRLYHFSLLKEKNDA